MPVSEKTFEQLALEDPDGQWELWCGRPRQKPGMTHEHNSTQRRLVAQLNRQLAPADFEVGSNAGYTQRSTQTYFVPDVMVIPTELFSSVQGTMKLETYAEPLPFVAEIWSRRTGGYDVETKFPEYKLRGDLEIWRLHPYEKTLIVWRRQADGSYSETHYTGGTVPVESLPGVVIEMDALFA